MDDAGRAFGQIPYEEEEDSDDVAVVAGHRDESDMSEGSTSDEGEEEKRGRQPLLKKAECIRLGLCHVCRCDV